MKPIFSSAARDEAGEHLMKKPILILTAVLFLPLTALSAVGVYPEQRGHRLEQLNKELDLNSEQKARLAEIFKQQQEKLRAIQEESHRRIKDVLNAEQIAKWERIRERRLWRHNAASKQSQERPEVDKAQ